MLGRSDADFHWLVGLLEGEGTFLKPSPSKPVRVIISVEMTDQDVIERVARIWGVSARPLALRNESWKQTYATRITGPRAYGWMQRLRPFMSIRRQGQIDRALLAA